MKVNHRIIGCLFAAFMFTGCQANRFEIEMKPAGRSVQRELTFWREQTANEKTTVVAFPAEELERIASAYEAAVPDNKARKHKFSRAFSGEMPNDVGGSGSYTHWETPLGSMSAYAERFRGNDDLLADLERRQTAADRISDLLIGWLAGELEGETGFADLREFLENDLRRDVKNLGLYGLAYEIVANNQEDPQEECIVRIGQYLLERSYFSVEQLPALTRALQGSDDHGSSRLLAHVQRFTAAKMGVDQDQPIPAKLQFLSDAATIESSINDYLRETDDFKRMLEAWEKEAATNPDAKAPQPNAVVGDLVAMAFLPNFQLGRPDQLDVKLAAASEPFATNGEWDEQAARILWSRRMLANDSELSGTPTFLYALWSSPDDQAQQAYFGKVVLDGDALGSYCLWYRGLSESEAKEWDAFVSSLRPDDGLIGRLRAFRFSHEPRAAKGDDKSGRQLAATPRRLILQGLTGETEAG